MCGIFYTNHPDRNINYTLFQRIKHRGPDVSVFREESGHTYGFHRLAIMEPHPKGNIVQPFFYKHIVVLCNGEIYNWKKIYQRYTYLFKPEEILPTDCGILPLLYEHEHEEFIKCIQELEGEFAIVLHDTRKQKMYAARDFMGIRPLYYTAHESYVWLASEMKALPEKYPVEHIQPRQVYCFDLNVQESETMYYSYEPYWKFPILSNALCSTPLSLITVQLYEHLRYSVCQRLHADQPIGCLLSGGIDSSLIASLASQFYPNLHCFTIGVPGSPDVEAAKCVAKYLNVPLTIVDMSIEEGIASIIPVIYHLETYDITTIRASIPQYLLAKWIRTHTDIKVILSGEGSDELFSGYIYSKLAPNAKELYQDGVRLLKDLYQYDCLRTDRVLSAWGLEVRVPFLHIPLVEYVLSLDPEFRICSSEKFHGLDRTLEKGLLRHMIQVYALLPEQIAKRPKEAFSDAVSASGQLSWYQSIQQWIEPFFDKKQLDDQRFIHNPPISKESMYYRQVFDLCFKKQSHILPKFWMPQWTPQVDPSATVLACHHSRKN
jgi:asparagine synthase (glutamine-hydrolysing)